MENCMFTAGSEIVLGNSTKVSTPLILPLSGTEEDAELIAGAAISGAIVVISSGIAFRDPAAQFSHGKLCSCPSLERVFRCFRKYHRGLGQFVVQISVQDAACGVAEYAVSGLGVDALEFVYAHAPNGFPAVQRLSTVEEALRARSQGRTVYPDPWDAKVQQNVQAGCAQYFREVQPDSVWEDQALDDTVTRLRRLGLKHVYLRMFDQRNFNTLKIAVRIRAEMISLDHSAPNQTVCRNEKATGEILNHLQQFREASVSGQADLPACAISNCFVCPGDLPERQANSNVQMITLCAHTVQAINALKPYISIDAILPRIHALCSQEQQLTRGIVACCSMLSQISKLTCAASESITANS